MIRSILIAIAATGLPVSSYAQSVSFEDKSKIEISHVSLFPEDLRYDAQTDSFFVGSFREGAIYQLDVDGNATLRFEDDRLISVLGNQLDRTRDRLYAVTADINGGTKKSAKVGNLAGLMVFDLKTNEVVGYVDLGSLVPGSRHMGNGIAMDDEGNIYVTDSFASTIYKITPNLEASVFLTSDEFNSDGIGLNGLVYHPEGYFVVVKKDDGRVFKIPKEKPELFSEIELEKPIKGADGVTFVNKQEILVVANRVPGSLTNSIFALSSDDNWETARIAKQKVMGDIYPTTSSIRQGVIYVVTSQIGDLVAASPEEKVQMRIIGHLHKLGEVNSTR